MGDINKVLLLFLTHCGKTTCCQCILYLIQCCQLYIFWTNSRQHWLYDSFFNCRWSHRLRRQQMLLASFVSQQHHVHVLGRSRGSPPEETTSISVGSISETSTISFWRRRQRSELCQTRCFWRQVRKHFFLFFQIGRYCFGYRTSQLTEFILVKQNCWKPSSGSSLSQYWLLTLYWMTMGNRSNLVAAATSMSDWFW